MSRAYRLSPAGRRDNLLLIAVAMMLWLFAIWSLANTLQVRLHPAGMWADVQRLFAQPPAIEQAVPALFLLVVIVATPMVIWNAIAEWDATFVPTADGLCYTTMGMRLCCRWHDIVNIQPTPVSAEEDVVLWLRYDPASTITHPLRRWLHRQYHGPNRLVIGAGIERRAELVALIEQALAATRSSFATTAA
jgi:hypothetical protein